MILLKNILRFLWSVIKELYHFSFFTYIILFFVTYFAAYIHPERFIILPILTLLFPVFLFSNLIWIVLFSITFQYKKLLISITLLILFFPEIKKYYNVSFTEKYSKNDKNILTVMSFNVKLFDLYNWQNNYNTREKIFDYLKNHPADIMCFQEFYTSEDTNDFNNLEALKKLFPAYYFHTKYFVTLRRNDHWGLLTISKYPIINQSAIYFNNAKNNGCIYTDIIFNQDTIRIFNLHLQSYSLFKKKKWKPNQKPENENFFQALDTTLKGKNLFQKIYLNNVFKTQQAETILKIIQQSHYPTIVVGDFNDIAHSYLMRQFIKNQIRDAFVEKGNGFGITYHDKIYLRIDYILHNPSFDVLDFNTDNNTATHHLSDHYPISCTLKLKSPG